MCTARKGVKDLPILAQGLSAIFLEGLPAVFVAEWRTGGLARRHYGGLA